MPPWITSLLRDDTPLPMPLRRLGDNDLMALERRRARDRKPHHTGADDQDLHGLSRALFIAACLPPATWAKPPRKKYLRTLEPNAGAPRPMNSSPSRPAPPAPLLPRHPLSQGSSNDWDHCQVSREPAAAFRRVFLTDGGIETTLIFLEGIELRCFASFELLNSPEGTAHLRRYFARYAAIARNAGWASCWKARPGAPMPIGPSSSDIPKRRSPISTARQST